MFNKNGLKHWWHLDLSEKILTGLFAVATIGTCSIIMLLPLIWFDTYASSLIVSTGTITRKEYRPPSTRLIPPVAVTRTSEQFLVYIRVKEQESFCFTNKSLWENLSVGDKVETQFKYGQWSKRIYFDSIKKKTPQNDFGRLFLSSLF